MKVYRIDVTDNGDPRLSMVTARIEQALRDADALIDARPDEFAEDADPYVFSREEARENLRREGCLILTCPDGVTITVVADEVEPHTRKPVPTME